MTLDEQLKRIQAKVLKDSGYPYPADADVEPNWALAHGLVIGAIARLQAEIKDNARPE